MFQGDLNEALALWRKAFADMKVHDQDHGVVEVEIAGQLLSLFDSPPVHDFGFTPSVSLLVEVDSAGDVDRLATLLGENGTALMPIDAYDFAERFVWLTDRFGVSWQIRFGAK